MPEGLTTRFKNPESRDFTTFVSHEGLLDLLAHLGKTYSRMVSYTISLSSNQEHSMLYLDNVITYSDDCERHAAHVEQILSMHSKYGLKLNLVRRQIFQSQVQS